MSVDKFECFVILPINIEGNMKILVTGGTGFIGSHTVVELFEAGYQPVIIDNFANSYPTVLEGLKKILGVDVAFFEGDCKDPQVLKQLLNTHHDIKGVIHFAADKAVGESVVNPLKYYQNNIGSLVNLLSILPEFGVETFVFSSSCTVYGQPDTLPVTEDAPVRPAMSPYGNTKQICEEILQDTIAAGVNIQVMSLRYFNPIGAHPSANIGELPIGVPNNLVPFITQTAAGLRDKLRIFGTDYNTPDGTAVRDYIHVVDLAKAHVKALKALEDMPKEPFYDFVNVGTGKGSSVLEVVKAFEQATGEKLKIELTDRRAGDVEQVYAAVEKSKELLKWQTEKTLEEALADAWRWQQKISRDTK